MDVMMSLQGMGNFLLYFGAALLAEAIFLLAYMAMTSHREAELIAKGKFPAPFKLVPGGRASCWLETTIDAWLQERADSGGKI